MFYKLIIVWGIQRKCRHDDAQYELKYEQNDFGSCNSQYLEKINVEFCECTKQCHLNVLCMGFSFQRPQGGKPVCTLHPRVNSDVVIYSAETQCFVNRNLILYNIYS